MKNEEMCPCKSGKTFGECCGPILAGKRKAATAEEMMRARYSAYAVCDVDFLYESSGPEVREQFSRETTKEWSEAATWEGLKILATEKGGPDDEEGYVSFIAHYTTKKDNKVCEHREDSVFKKIKGEWRFIDGVMDTGTPYVREEPKIGRNDPCPCGSGKKYKKCCGKGKE